jgi:hypothetical protein
MSGGDGSFHSGSRQLHCRVRETVQSFRDMVLPSNMEEGKQLKCTSHFIFYVFRQICFIL